MQHLLVCVRTGAGITESSENMRARSGSKPGRGSQQFSRVNVAGGPGRNPYGSPKLQHLLAQGKVGSEGGVGQQQHLLPDMGARSGQGPGWSSWGHPDQVVAPASTCKAGYEARLG